MEIVKSFFQIFAIVFACLAVLISIPLFFRFRWPAMAMWVLKLYVSALSPELEVVGALVFIVGFATSSVFISLMGILVVFIFLIHIFSITRQSCIASNFKQTFGLDWEKAYLQNKKLTSFHHVLLFQNLY